MTSSPKRARSVAAVRAPPCPDQRAAATSDMLPSGTTPSLCRQKPNHCRAQRVRYRRCRPEPRRDRRGRRRERLLHDPEHPRAPSLLDRCEPGELEPAQLDPPLARAGTKPNSSRKSRGKTVRWTRSRCSPHRARGSGRRTPRAPLRPVARLPDRREQKRLQNPVVLRAGQVGTGDEHRVVRGRPGREVVRPREQTCGAVLHRAEDGAVVVVVDRPPLAVVLLDALDPPLLRRRPVAARLPPDAVAAHRGRAERRASPATRDGTQTSTTRTQPPSGGDPKSSTTTSTEAVSRSVIRPRYSATRCWTAIPTDGAFAPHSRPRCSSTPGRRGCRSRGRRGVAAASPRRAAAHRRSRGPRRPHTARPRPSR